MADDNTTRVEKIHGLSASPSHQNPPSKAPSVTSPASLDAYKKGLDRGFVPSTDSPPSSPAISTKNRGDTAEILSTIHKITTEIEGNALKTSLPLK